MKRLIMSSLGLFVVRGFSVFLQAGAFIYIARCLAISDVGVFSTTYAFLLLVRYLGPLGSDQVAMRDIARADANAFDLKRKIACMSLTLTCTASLGVLLALMLAIQFGFGRAGVVRSEALATCLAIPAFSLSGAFMGVIRGHGHNLAAQAPEALGHHLLFLILLVGVGWVDEISRQAVFGCLCAAAWGVLVAYVCIYRVIDRNRFELPRPRELRNIAREGFTVFQALLWTALSSRAPILCASALAGPAAAAVMDVAIRFGSVPTLTTGSVGTTLAPYFARYSHEAEQAKIIETLKLGTVLAALPALAWVGVVAFGARYAVGSVLPAAYAEAIGPMFLVALALAINAACSMSGHFMLMSGEARIVGWFSLGQLVVICAVSLLLTPSLGALGIGWGIVIGALTRDGGSMAYVLMTPRIPAAARERAVFRQL